MNNCKYCKYYAEYAGDAKFTPLPVCQRYSDLKSAAEAIKNSDSCEFNKKINDANKIVAAYVVKGSIAMLNNSLKDAIEAIKEYNEALKNFKKEAQNE